MFETKIEDEGIADRIRNWFGEKLFPVNIAKRKDYLIIEDRRIRGSILFPMIAVGIICGILSLIFPWMTSSFWSFVATILVSILIIFSFLVLVSSYFAQTAIFYKDKNLYEISSKGLFGSRHETGNISEIKEIKIISRRYENNDGQVSYTFTSQIIPKRLILDDWRNQSLQKETIFNSYETTTRIVFAITDFLEIPYSEDELG